MSENRSVQVQWIPLRPDSFVPERMTAEAAGFDIRASLPSGELRLEPLQRMLIPTGFALVMPPGYEAQIRPRSGLAIRNGITVLNSPGTIDSDYRGEVSVILVNFGDAPFVVEHGLRIAQMVFSRVLAVELVEGNNLPSSARGEAGFGSTGAK